MSRRMVPGLVADAEPNNCTANRLHEFQAVRSSVEMPRPSFLDLEKFQISFYRLQVGIQNGDIRKVSVVVHQDMLPITGKDTDTNGHAIILNGNGDSWEVLVKPNEFELDRACGRTFAGVEL